VFTDTGYGNDCVEKYVTSLTGQVDSGRFALRLTGDARAP
jgi:hypothetical protein